MDVYPGDYFVDKEMTAGEDLTAYVLGTMALQYLQEKDALRVAVRESETLAMQALEDIRLVINDESLEDPECFKRIEAILNVFEKNRIGIYRHDW